MDFPFTREWRRLALAGERSAVALLAQVALPPLYQFCLYRVGKDAHMCEEIVQETLCRALRQLEQYTPERAGNNIHPWLTGLARNEISRALHRDRQRVSLNALWEKLDQELLAVYERLEEEPLAEEVVQREETRELVHMTLSQLPSHYREALEAKYLRGASVRDLAELWHTTDKAVESMLTRARKAFRSTFVALGRTLGPQML